MSYGPGQNVIASGVIQVNADLTEFNENINKIPANMQVKAKAAMAALQREIAATQKQIDKVSSAKITNVSQYAQQQAQLAALRQRYAELDTAVKVFVADVENEASILAAATKATKDQEKADRDAAKAKRENAQAARQLASDMAKAAKAAEAQQTALNKASLDKKNGGKGGGGNSGFGILMLSQAIEDAQYGFSAIVNNIPGIVMAFGGSGGIAGAVSIASVAVNLFINNWTKLKEGLGFGSHLKSATEEMEELEKITNKTAGQLERMKKLGDMAAFGKAIERPNDIEQRRVSGTEDAFVNAGMKNIVAAVKAQHGTAISNSIDQNIFEEQRKAREAVQDKYGFNEFIGSRPGGSLLGFDKASLQKRLDDANNAFNKAYGDAVNKIIQEIGTDEKKLREFQKRVAANPDAYGPKGRNLAADLRSALPEGRADQTRAEANSNFLAAQRELNEQKERKYWSDVEKRGEADQADFDAILAKRQSDASQRASSMDSGKITKMILGNIINGIATSGDELNKSIQDSMRLSGETEEDIKRLTPEIATIMMRGVRDRVREFAEREGISREEAARRINRDNQQDMQRRRIAELNRDPGREKEELDQEERNAIIMNRAIRASENPTVPVPADYDKTKKMTQSRRNQLDMNENAADRRKRAQLKLNENARVRRLQGTKKGRDQLTLEAKQKADKEASLKMNLTQGEKDDQAKREAEMKAAEAAIATAKSTAESKDILAACQTALQAMQGGMPARVGP